MAKRRANGEGNIRKRKDGRWEGRYTAGYGPDGKRIMKNVLGKTQAEAREKLAAAMEDTKGLDIARADDYTLLSWLRTWYQLYAKPNIRPSTALWTGHAGSGSSPAIPPRTASFQSCPGRR